MDERGEGNDQAGAQAHGEGPPNPYELRRRPDGSTVWQLRRDHRALAAAWVETQPDKGAAMEALLKQAFAFRGWKI